MNLRRGILNTLAFYNAEGKISMSPEELFLNLSIPKNKVSSLSLGEFKQRLQHNLYTKKYFDGNSNYLFLKESDDDELRFKIETLKKFLPFLLLAPYTKIIFLAGSTALGQPKSDSDIDLVIISKRERVWLNRIFLEGISFLFGHRRNKKELTNRFCFNLFLSEKAPLLPHQDFIGANFYKHLIPVWTTNPSNIKQFWRANSWLKNYSPLFNLIMKPIIRNKFPASNFIRNFLETLLDKTFSGQFLEKVSFQLQKIHLESALKKSKVLTPGQFDFKITPDAIVYHFPMSNHSRISQKYNEMVGI